MSLDCVDVFQVRDDLSLSIKNGGQFIDIGIIGVDVPFGAEPQEAVLLCQTPDVCGDSA